MTSEFTVDQENEIRSRNFLSEFCIDQGWKFRDNQLDNDIDGEIEIFDEERKSTAKFIKVQLKAVRKTKDSKEELIKYNCSRKFMAFVDVCDIPIILVLYDVEKKKCYYLYMQEYIFNFLDENNSNWRSNSTNVTVKISTKNELNKADDAIDTLTRIGFKGIYEIQQNRQRKSFLDYFYVVKQNDISFGSVASNEFHVILSSLLTTSRASVKYIIPKIISHLLEEPYFKDSQSKEKLRHSYFSFFSNGLFFNRGLPFLFCQYKEEGLDQNQSLEFEEVENDISWTWFNHNITNLYLNTKTISKKEYLNKGNTIAEKTEAAIVMCDKLHNQLIFEIDNDITVLNNYISSVIEQNFYDIEKYPYECKGIQLFILKLYNSFSNMDTYLKEVLLSKEAKQFDAFQVLSDIPILLEKLVYEVKRIA